VVIIVLMWTCFFLQVVLLVLSYKWNLKVVYIQTILWHFRLFVGLVGKPFFFGECIPRDVFEPDTLDTIQQLAMIMTNSWVMMYLHDKHSGKIFALTLLCALFCLVEVLTGYQNIMRVGLRLYSHDPLLVIIS